MPWVYKDWNVKKSFYVLSATHRGDMYHVRASLVGRLLGGPSQLRPLMLYECADPEKVAKAQQNKTVDLETYLSEYFLANKADVLQVPWSYDDIKNSAKKPTIDKLCKRNGEQLKEADIVWQDEKMGRITEGGATISFASVGAGLEKVPLGMITYGPDQVSQKQKLYDFFGSKAFEAVDPLKNLNLAGSVALVMHRDTGASESGAYPELDTGRGLGELCELVDSIRNPQIPQMKLTPVISGAPDPNGRWRSISQYWTSWSKVDGVPKEFSSRAVEAAYLLYCYEKGRFCMAVGLRSGALDLFTFLGIPTVSIGLENMVGEDRHNILGKGRFKRINVEYEKPRHPATAWIDSSRNNAGANLFFQSPWWSNNDRAPRGAARVRTPLTDKEKIAAKSVEPSGWDSIDKLTISIGLSLAATRYLVKPLDFPPLYHQDAESGALITTAVVTTTWLMPPDGTEVGSETTAPKPLDAARQQVNNDHVPAMELMVESLQEPQGVTEARKLKWKNGWNQLYLTQPAENSGPSNQNPS